MLCSNIILFNMRLTSKDERVLYNFCCWFFRNLDKRKAPFLKKYKKRGENKRDLNIYIGNVKF